MPYRLTHFSPGLVQIAVFGHIEIEDVEAMRDESALVHRHIVEPLDAIIDATGFTGLNPLALTTLRELPLPPQLRAVAVVLGGWQLLASKALPHIDGLVFVGSVEEAQQALAEAPPLALPRAQMAGRAAEPAPQPLPQVRRLPTRPLPHAHRHSTPRSADAVAGSVLGGLTGQMNRIAQRLEQLRDR